MDFTQWSTAVPLISQRPQWVSGPDQDRIAAYHLYEMMYWNVPESYKLIQRGSDNKPIYIPSAKVIVETMHRYLAPKMSVIVDPTVGSAQEQAAATIVMNSLLARERLLSKFSTNKRYGLIRGDWLFRIRADVDRPEGSRISIEMVDPASYFPITDPDDIDVRIGCHLVDQIEFEGKARIHRQTYRKTTETGGPSPITLEETIFEVDKWGGPDMDETAVKVVTPEFTLPEPINHLPIYHFQNFQETGTEWGSSEFRGMERMIAAINQSISDEDLELVLNGLGVYVTDAGAPVDANGDPTAWNLGPARVIELPAGKQFNRVSGVASVEPHQAHLKYLHEQLDLGSATPAVAKGMVDVAVAESGIALALKFAPIFSRAEEKETIITDVTANLLWDLKDWFAAYEATDLGAAVWLPQYGDRIPQNRKERFDEIMELLSAKVVSAIWARGELRKIGYEFPDDTQMAAEMLDEEAMRAQVQADVIGARIDAVLNEEGGNE